MGYRRFFGHDKLTGYQGTRWESLFERYWRACCNKICRRTSKSCHWPCKMGEILMTISKVWYLPGVAERFGIGK